MVESSLLSELKVVCEDVEAVVLVVGLEQLLFGLLDEAVVLRVVFHLGPEDEEDVAQLDPDGLRVRGRDPLDGAGQ